MEHRLRVTISNQERDYQRTRDQFEALIGGKVPDQAANVELGLYSLAYLRKECEKQNVHVEISMNRVPRSDLALINLVLQL